MHPPASVGSAFPPWDATPKGGTKYQQSRLVSVVRQKDHANQMDLETVSPLLKTEFCSCFLEIQMFWRVWETIKSKILFFIGKIPILPTKMVSQFLLFHCYFTGCIHDISGHFLSKSPTNKKDQINQVAGNRSACWLVCRLLVKLLFKSTAKRS